MTAKNQVRLYLIDTSSDAPPGHVVPFFTYLLLALVEMGYEVKWAVSQTFRNSVLVELSGLRRSHPFAQLSIIGSPKTFLDAYHLVRDDVIQNPAERTILFWPSWPQVDLQSLSHIGSSVPSSFEIVTLANISNFVRQHDNKSVDAKFLQEAIALPQISTIFYWDTFESFQLPTILQPKCRKIEEFHDGIVGEGNEDIVKLADVGFFGSSLSASRGLIEFVWLALLNPRLQFLASGGEIVWTGGYFTQRAKHRWLIRKLLAVLDLFIGFSARKLANHLQNLRFEMRYSSSQVALNDHLRRVQFVFTAGHIHPYSSGIALQSLALGVPVLWTPGDSAASDHLAVLCNAGRLTRRDFFVSNSLTFKTRTQAIQPVHEQVVSWGRFKASLASGLNLST